MRSVLLGLALLLATAIPAAAADVSYQIANDSELAIMEIYASPAGERVWGEDLLRARVLPRNEVGRLLISDVNSRCHYDLRLIFENGQELVRATNLCDGTGFRVRGTPWG